MANYNLFDAASLAMVPTGVKDGKLYSVKPDDGSGDFTFSRGSDWATRVNADGLIEKERTNLLLQSNNFDTTWLLQTSALTSGQVGYDGTNNAWLLERQTTGSAAVYQVISVSGVHTFSVYAKAGTADGIRIRIDQTTDANLYVDLTDGSIINQLDNISANVTAVGNGWHRVEIAYLASGMINAQIRVVDNGGAAALGTIYIQDAQLEQGLVATDYIETTTSSVTVGITDDLPRIDYSNGCGALLLEPQRTNGFPHSEYLGQWSANRLNRTANNVDSPEGVQNAYKMTQQSGFTTAGNINYAGITAGTKTLSIFAKAGTFDHIALSYNGVTYFNLTNGTIGTTASGHTAVITDMGDGWYRCAITKTTTGTYTAAYYFAQNNGTLTTTDTQGYMYAYGAMIETGSYPTSYIPTYGSSATRTDDSCLATSVSDLIGQEQGTLFFDYVYLGLEAVNQNWFAIQNTTATDRILFYSTGNSSNLRFLLSANNSTLIDNSALITETAGTRYKVAVSYISGAVNIFINGTKIIGYTTDFTFANDMSILTFKQANQQPASKINQVAIFPTVLTDNECKALTRPYDTYQEWVDGEGLTWESKSCTVQNIVELQNL